MPAISGAKSRGGGGVGGGGQRRVNSDEDYMQGDTREILREIPASSRGREGYTQMQPRGLFPAQLPRIPRTPNLGEISETFSALVNSLHKKSLYEVRFLFLENF